MNINSRGDQFGDRPLTTGSNEFALTLLSDVPLTKRLLTELSFVIRRIKQVWPDFKEHPVKVINSEVRRSVEW